MIFLKFLTYDVYLGIYNFFFSHHAACGILVPNWGLNPSPQQWKLWVLISQLPRKSLNCSFIYTSFLKDFDCTDCFYRNTSFSVMGRFNHFNTLVIVQWGNKVPWRLGWRLLGNSATGAFAHPGQSGCSHSWVPSLPTAEANTQPPTWPHSPGSQPAAWWCVA